MLMKIYDLFIEYLLLVGNKFDINDLLIFYFVLYFKILFFISKLY